MAPTIRIDDEVYALLREQATPFADTPNDVLRRLLLPNADWPKRSKRPRSAMNKISAMIDAGVLAQGEALDWVRRNRGIQHVATVGVDGTLTLEDATVHATPSAAAKHLAGYEVNGWRVWRVRRTSRSLSEEWIRMGKTGSVILGNGLTAETAKGDVMVEPCEDGFVEDLPPSLLAAGKELLRRVRVNWPGRLSKEGARYVNRPDNFWTVKIQPRDGSLAITVRGNPEKFGESSLGLKADRPGYSRFKVLNVDDVDPAIEVLRRASKQV